MKSSFQTIIITVFIIGFVIAIAIFSGLFSSSTKKTSTVPTGNVVIWGVLPNDAMQTYVQAFNSEAKGYTLSYSYHAPANFYQDLITALANNQSPDVVLASSEIFSQFQNKLYTIPYAAYNERTYRDTNIDGAQIFLNTNGVIAQPLLVDPLVVYYNKDILAARNFVVPPATWNGLEAAVPLLTKKDSKGSISQTAIALGETSNIANYRDILSTLFLQTGNNIIDYNATTGTYQAGLTDAATTTTTSDTTGLPTAQALTFYTSFANPTNTNYSWNNSLPDSLQNFLAGNSAFYIGRASELFSIQAQNPNLNFDVMPMFQADNSTRPVTYGSFIGAAVMKNAPNFNAAYAAATAMATSTEMDTLSKSFSLPPVRRDLLQVAQSNPYVSVFFTAALSTFSWPDPNPATTDTIFRAMIDGVNSNTTDVQTAILNADRDLQSSITN